jgi:hypothetical protein
MRQKNRKIMAAGMAAVTLCTSLVSTPVYAAEASVSVDESMYVNLDYYGSVDKVNVVKGVSLNGLTSFTDYGNYLDVTNMTTIRPRRSETEKLPGISRPTQRDIFTIKERSTRTR